MAISQRVRNNAGGKLLGSRVLGDEGREGWGRESCNKGPGLFQGKKGAAGQEGGHYKKDELRLDLQRHSVSQAATTP